MLDGLPAIQVDGLWKTYPLRPIGAASRWARRRTEPFHALKDVSFELPVGSVLGVLGVNGAGKSTLLKVLAQITDPSRGRVLIRGRVASLLEVGTGFHGELTGRENIFLNAAIHGMARREVHRRLESILDFAGVGDFIDIPVKRYSSGMYLRVAFSVAAHLDPDIFIVDELLAVGDSAFRQKCLNTMDRAAHEGRTVILVSHELSSVQALCTEAIRLHAGCLVDRGATRDVVERYLHAVYAQGGHVHLNAGALELHGARGEYTLDDQLMAKVDIELALCVKRDLGRLTVDVTLDGPGGVRLFQAMPSAGLGPATAARIGDTVTVRLSFRLPALAPGRYEGSVWAQSRGHEDLLHVSHIPLFDVAADPRLPEAIQPSFSASLLPRHSMTVEVETA